MPIWDIKRRSRETSRKTGKEDTVITREQAVKFSESGWWEGKTACEITALQLYESRLCMPEFQMFHEAVEVALGRPVFTHEFAFVQRLQKEFEEKYPEAAELKAQMQSEKDAFCSTLEPDAAHPRDEPLDEESGLGLRM